MNGMYHNSYQHGAITKLCIIKKEWFDMKLDAKKNVLPKESGP